ncbi:hypothetical protein ACQEU6_30970 [Spirillospora sp. CA-108201]
MSDQTICRPSRTKTGSQSGGGVAGLLNRSASSPRPSSRARSAQSAATGSAGTAEKVATSGR